MLELYIVDKVKKGVFIFLRLFIDDSAMSLTKLNIEVSNECIHRCLCTGWSKDVVVFMGLHSYLLRRMCSS